MVETNPTTTQSFRPRVSRRPAWSPLTLVTVPRPKEKARPNSRTRAARARAERVSSGVVVLPPMERALPREARSRARRKVGVLSLNRILSRLLRGDSAVITTFVACTGMVCLLGTAYLATCARATKEEQDIRTLQLNLAAAQARHQALVQDLTRLQSLSRASTIASELHMLPAGQSEYIDVPAQQGQVDQLASAR